MGNINGSSDRFVLVRPNPATTMVAEIKIKEHELKDKKRVQKHNGEFVYKENPLKGLTRLPDTSVTITEGTKGSTSCFFEMIDNPYFNNKEVGKLPVEFQTVLGNAKALRHHILEYKHNQTLNYYKPIISQDQARLLKNNPNSEARYFLNPKSFMLKDGLTVLDLDNPKDELRYYVLKDISFISEAEQANPIDYPFMMKLSDVKVEKKDITVLKTSNQAINIIHQLYEEKSKIIVDFAILSEIQGVSIDSDKDEAYGALTLALKEMQPEKALQLAKNLISFFNQYKEPTTKPLFLADLSIAKALRIGFVRYNGVSYYWNSPKEDGMGVEPLEFTKDRLREFLTLPEWKKEATKFNRLLDEAIKRV